MGMCAARCCSVHTPAEPMSISAAVSLPEQPKSHTSCCHWQVLRPLHVSNSCCLCMSRHDPVLCDTRHVMLTAATAIVNTTLRAARTALLNQPARAARRAKADSWAGQAQTRFWAAWAHVAYRVQYSRYLAFYCLICAGLGTAH